MTEPIRFPERWWPDYLAACSARAGALPVEPQWFRDYCVLRKGGKEAS